MADKKTNAKRFPLPKRFSAAMSDKAYTTLRALNARYGYGNNYLLTILLENLEDYANPEKLDKVFQHYVAEYGAPKTNPVKKSDQKRGPES